MKKRVGITGASGFIGKRLVQRLIKDNYSVTIFSRSSVSFPPDVNVVIGNFEEDQHIDDFLKSVDSVIHLASRQVPPEKLFFDDNVGVTNMLVDRMIHFPISQLIYLSTVAVYGDQEDKVHNENDICHPTTKYGVTKYLAEQLCLSWKLQTKKTLTILRPFNIYGNGSTKGVIYNMINNIRNDKPINLFGGGKQQRDFLYVDDVIEAIVLSLEKEQDGIFNLGTGINITILEIVDHLKKIFPTKVTVDFMDEEKGKPSNIFYSTENAQKKLGWNASINIKEGLEKML